MPKATTKTAQPSGTVWGALTLVKYPITKKRSSIIKLSCKYVLSESVEYLGYKVGTRIRFPKTLFVDEEPVELCPIFDDRDELVDVHVRQSGSTATVFIDGVYQLKPVAKPCSHSVEHDTCRCSSLKDGSTLSFGSLKDRRCISYRLTVSITPPAPVVTPFEEGYVQVRQLGRGRHAIVYLAVDKQSGERRAAKIMLEKLGQKEVEILKSLTHPNIVEYIDCLGAPLGQMALIMPSVGQTLHTYVEKSGHLTEREARVIGRQILSAISYMTGKGVHHRDLHPDNILVWKRTATATHAYIVDFGLALSTSEGNTQPFEHFCGTAPYIAPERLKCSPSSFITEVYSLGALVHNMLGGLPSKGHPRERYLKPDGEARLHGVTISESARSFVFDTLQAEPAERLDKDRALSHAWFSEKLNAAPLVLSDTEE